ncbi:MAG: inositol monophosphatase family protein [Ferruginibacter sp.]|nr:inositol monophosphatase [Bacteroidota bacterium]MBX2918183.1 inositol monophosphatase [Ferruginibacter sp.]MCC7380147.1 inositol monophosphatase [Chitinophagaceae bacterium]
MLKTTLLHAVEAGAKELRHFFNNDDLKISNKEGINNWVTEADHAAEKAIIDCIKAQYPNHFILSEEVGEIITNSDTKWIIDPIDGTINFASGIPLCCVSIGVEYNGQMILGAVYNPFINEMFLAEKGKGATLNDKKIHVSKKTSVLHSCLVTGFPYTYLDMPNGPLQVFEKLIRKGVPVRRIGSAAIDLCWVAAGRFEGFFEHSLSAWDTAAGYLIVEEAGGKVTDMDGNKYSPYQKKLVATNGLIHNELLDVIHNRKQL